MKVFTWIEITTPTTSYSMTLVGEKQTTLCFTNIHHTLFPSVITISTQRLPAAPLQWLHVKVRGGSRNSPSACSPGTAPNAAQLSPPAPSSLRTLLIPLLEGLLDPITRIAIRVTIISPIVRKFFPPKSCPPASFLVSPYLVLLIFARCRRYVRHCVGFWPPSTS